MEGGARKGEWNKPDGWKVRAWPGMLKQHGVKGERREDGSVGRTIKESRTECDGASGSTLAEVGRSAVRGRVDLAAVRMPLLLFLPSPDPAQFAPISIAVAALLECVPKSTALKL